MGPHVVFGEAVEELHRHLQAQLRLAGIAELQPPGPQRRRQDQRPHHQPGHHHRQGDRDPPEERDCEGHGRLELLHQTHFDLFQKTASHRLPTYGTHGPPSGLTSLIVRQIPRFG